MQQPQKWIWGLIPVAAVWLVVGLVQTGRVEQDLNTRATAAITSKGVLAPEITVRGRDVTVSGTRLADNSADIVGAIGAENGVRLVRDTTKLIVGATPYDWSLVREGGNVTLGGHVPDTTVRGELLAMATKTFDGAHITDLATYARGASDNLDKLAEVAAGVIAPLSHGRIDIVDGKVSVSGEATTVAAYNAAMSAIKALPATALGKVEILPRLAAPYTFDARKSENQLVLSGFFPDEQTHLDWLALAKSHFFGTEVVDKLEFARGVPNDFGAAVKFGLGQLSRMDSGTLSMADSKFSLKGVALFAKAAQQIKDAVASSLPKGFTGESELTVKQELASKLDASACQSQLAATNARGRILFDTGDATIAETSYGLLDELVFVAENCSVERIVVTGHTDAVGQADANLDLSRRRAKAVADYLTASGVAPERIEVVGLGQTKPIASNDTEEGRAMNRRIEFSVQ